MGFKVPNGALVQWLGNWGGIRWQEDGLKIGQVRNRQIRWTVVKKLSVDTFGQACVFIPRISVFFCALNKRGKVFAFSNQPNFFYFANTSMGSFPRVVPVADILPYCSSTQSTFYLWSDRVCSGGIWKRDQIYRRSKYLFIHN